jgi:hypothetical protein
MVRDRAREGDGMAMMMRMILFAAVVMIAVGVSPGLAAI